MREPILEENKDMEIALQLWCENQEGQLEMQMELPVHQIMDAMIFWGRVMLYFRDAYRIPGLYDQKVPIVERIGLQGDAMQVEVCAENPNPEKDIRGFADALNRMGELTGERLQVLARIFEALEYC